jgi:hypothetical protein
MEKIKFQGHLIVKWMLGAGELSSVFLRKDAREREKK